MRDTRRWLGQVLSKECLGPNTNEHPNPLTPLPLPMESGRCATQGAISAMAAASARGMTLGGSGAPNRVTLNLPSAKA